MPASQAFRILYVSWAAIAGRTRCRFLVLSQKNICQAGSQLQSRPRDKGGCERAVPDRPESEIHFRQRQETLPAEEAPKHAGEKSGFELRKQTS